MTLRELIRLTFACWMPEVHFILSSESILSVHWVLYQYNILYISYGYQSCTFYHNSHGRVIYIQLADGNWLNDSENADFLADKNCVGTGYTTVGVLGMYGVYPVWRYILAMQKYRECKFQGMIQYDPYDVKRTVVFIARSSSPLNYMIVGRAIGGSQGSIFA